jgi:hypothetical protein
LGDLKVFFEVPAITLSQRVVLLVQDLFNRFKSNVEEILIELFETGTSEGSVEIDALEERVGFDGCLGSRRQGTVVLRLMRAVMTPPAVSIPRERGATLRRRS